MNIIFLRGAIPPINEHPEKLLYNDINDSEDMWTQLFYFISKKLNARSEMLYNGGSKEVFVDDNFSEKWVSLKKYTPEFKPDLIFCRGGFDFYLDFIKKYPAAKKIYYGAGKRFFPQDGYYNYDLFLVDSISQLNYIRKNKKNASLFIKPAATLFQPVNCFKTHDVCFVANYSQAKIKRHGLLIDAVGKLGVKTIIVGNVDKNSSDYYNSLRYKNIKWTGWVPRKDIPGIISSCKIGVCCSTFYDSCPRVIPEYLSCNVPVAITSNINIWKEKYITMETGIEIDEKKIILGIENCLKLNLTPYKYYSDNLSMAAATNFLSEKILLLFSLKIGEVNVNKINC